MIDLEDIETTKNEKKILKVELENKLKDYSGSNPISFLNAYYNIYNQKKRELLSSGKYDLREEINDFVSYFKEFLKLDLGNIIELLIKNKNLSLFDWLYIMKENNIIEEAFYSSTSFQKLQDFIADEKELKAIIQSSNNQRFHIVNKDTNQQFLNLESEKNTNLFYIISIQSGSYVKSFNTSNYFNILDVTKSILITQGLEYKSHFSFDSLIYLEV